MMPDSLSLASTRNLLLATQGLAQLPVQPAVKQDVLAAIRRMGVLQIDTIHVIARSPYLVLWSRLSDYPPAWLDELLAEGALFEYWSHAMCFLPVEDYPLYRRTMLEGSRRWGDPAQWVEQHPEVNKLVMDRIRAEGGLRSADFQNGDKPPGGWWNWKDEKTALECQFILGELMVARRRSFQRVYDLRQRVLPGWQDGPENANVPPIEEVLLEFTLRTVQALGVAHARWVPDYYRLPKTGNLARLETLAGEGRLLRVKIEGLPGPAYLDPAAQPAEPSNVTALLSPFDPVVWDRQRLRDLFNFEYTIECYTPAHKRPFGYFTLPILHRGQMVGRLDPKAHRAQGIFEVKALALEPGVEPTEDLVEGLAGALRRMAAWHGTPEVVIRRAEPEGLGERVMAAIHANL